MIALAVTGPSMFIALGGAYLSAGCVTAAILLQKGHPRLTAATALIAWPVMLPAAGLGAVRGGVEGPLRKRIDSTLDALEVTLKDPIADAGEQDTGALRSSLHRADERIALVDRLAAEAAGDPGAGEVLRTLNSARAHAVAEIEAVLADLVQLRLQIGLVALEGDRAPVKERLQELRMRLSALDEVVRTRP